MAGMILRRSDAGRDQRKSEQTIAHHIPPIGRTSIQAAIAIIIRFSVRETNPRGTLLDPPTHAHLSSRRSI
jgi:hypothetical protein